MAFGYGTTSAMVDSAISTQLGHLQLHASGFAENPSLARTISDGAYLATRVVGTNPAVRAWAPRVRTQGLVYSSYGSSGARLVGVDPTREVNVSALAHSLVTGTWLDGTPRRVLVGEALADRMRVAVGDKLVISVQDVNGEMTGEALRVGGIFRTPLGEVDRTTLFVDLSELQQMLGLGSALSEIVVLAHSPAEIPALREQLAAGVGDGIEVETWRDLEPILVFLVQFFEAQAGGMYVAVFVAMILGIANVQLMAVYERISELGVLAALGMRAGRLVSMLVAESILLAMVGVLIGVGLGLGFMTMFADGIDVSGFTMARAYGVGSRIVPALRIGDLAVPLAAAVICAFAASLLPILRAVRIQPTEAIRQI